MTFLSPNGRGLSNGEAGFMFGCSKDSGTVATEDETRVSYYGESSDSSNGTGTSNAPQLNHDDNHSSFSRRYQQIEEDDEEEEETASSASVDTEEVSCTSGECTYTSSSTYSSGWDSDYDNLLIWMNETIIRPKVKVLPWMRAEVDGTTRRRRPLFNPVSSAPTNNVFAPPPVSPEEAEVEVEVEVEVEQQQQQKAEIANAWLEQQMSRVGTRPSCQSEEQQEEDEENVYGADCDDGSESESDDESSRSSDDSYSRSHQGDEPMHVVSAIKSQKPQSHNNGHQGYSTNQGFTHGANGEGVADVNEKGNYSLSSAIGAAQHVTAENIPQFSAPDLLASISRNGALQGFPFATNETVVVHQRTYLTSAIDPKDHVTNKDVPVSAPDMLASIRRNEALRQHQEHPLEQPDDDSTGIGEDSSDESFESISDDDSSNQEEEEEDWSVDETELNGHKEFVDGELERKKAYGGWRSVSSKDSTCSSLSDLSITGYQMATDEVEAADRRDGPPREISTPPPDVVAQASFAAAAALQEAAAGPVARGPPKEISSPSPDGFGMASFAANGNNEAKNPIMKRRVQNVSKEMKNEHPISSGRLASYLANKKNQQQNNVSFAVQSTTEMTLESHSTDFSYKVDLPDPIDYEDITDDEYFKKICGKLYRKLNHDPWDEFNKYRDDDVCDFIRLHPETCKVRYDFDHFSTKLFPLSMLCCLGATRHTVELAFEAFEGALNESDLCIGTPLHYAATYKAKPSVVEFLVESDETSMLMSVNQFGRTPLHMGCLFKAPSKTVTYLLNESPESAKVVDKDGCSPLHLACEHGANNDVIRRLVAANPSMCLSVSKEGATPLHLSCSQGTSRATTRALIQAHPEAAGYQDIDGMTPLHLAAQANAPLGIIEMLVKSSPDSVEKKSNRGLTALRIAKQKKAAFPILKLLGL